MVGDSRRGVARLGDQASSGRCLTSTRRGRRLSHSGYGSGSPFERARARRLDRGRLNHPSRRSNRGEIETDQEPDVGQTDAKFSHDNGGDCRDRLKLEGHAEADNKEQSEDGPAAVRIRGPHQRQLSAARMSRSQASLCQVARKPGAARITSCSERSQRVGSCRWVQAEGGHAQNSG